MGCSIYKNYDRITKKINIIARKADLTLDEMEIVEEFEFFISNDWIDQDILMFNIGVK